MRGLSKRQLETLQNLADFNHEHGYFPSVRELCGAMGISSTNTVQSHLKALEKKGYLLREGSQARALQLTEKAHQEAFAGKHQRNGRRPRSKGVPLLGVVPAGPLSEAIESLEGYYQLEDFLPINSRTYALTAKGDSMRDKGIQDGDTLIIHQEADVDSGDVVVALLDGETTVKTLIRRIDGLTLQPANEFYEPVYIPLDHPGFQICGKVVGVIHKI